MVRPTDLMLNQTVAIVYQAITIMLVLIVTQFLVYNSIAFTNNILDFHFQLLIELSTIFANLNGATTIIYYFVLGTKYRRVGRQIIRRLMNYLFCSKKAQNNPSGQTYNNVTTKIYNNWSKHRKLAYSFTLACKLV
ncbi:unnamed protein product [Thelazia callipaeda]|uniref:G-protein coupled receptors family 1 profile domain-containing protein n=1 Tax=Thelazia callipaeda TaxID=103827 RepID=A0A0N5CSG0_THECL|nr:unnamed protein product [Thelazia callipaeda]